MLLSLVLLSICLIDDLVSLPVGLIVYSNKLLCIIYPTRDVSLINLGALLGEGEIILNEYIAFILLFFVS